MAGILSRSGDLGFMAEIRASGLDFLLEAGILALRLDMGLEAEIWAFG